MFVCMGVFCVGCRFTCVNAYLYIYVIMIKKHKYYFALYAYHWNDDFWIYPIIKIETEK